MILSTNRHPISRPFCVALYLLYDIKFYRSYSWDACALASVLVLRYTYCQEKKFYQSSRWDACALPGTPPFVAGWPRGFASIISDLACYKCLSNDFFLMKSRVFFSGNSAESSMYYPANNIASFPLQGIIGTFLTLKARTYTALILLSVDFAGCRLLWF